MKKKKCLFHEYVSPSEIPISSPYAGLQFDLMARYMKVCKRCGKAVLNIPMLTRGGVSE